MTPSLSTANNERESPLTMEYTSSLFVPASLSVTVSLSTEVPFSTASETVTLYFEGVKTGLWSFTSSTVMITSAYAEKSGSRAAIKSE